MNVPGRTSRSRRPRRRGAAAVEAAIVLLSLLLVIFCTFDLGLASFRRNAIHEAARSVARAAIVRGADAESDRWGPTSFDGTLAANSPYAQHARPSLATMDLEQVHLKIDWPDGDAQADSRVRVTIAYRHKPIVPLFYGPIDLASTSTMRIVQ